MVVAALLNVAGGRRRFPTSVVALAAITDLVCTTIVAFALAPPRADICTVAIGTVLVLWTGVVVGNACSILVSKLRGIPASRDTIRPAVVVSTHPFVEPMQQATVLHRVGLNGPT